MSGASSYHAGLTAEQLAEARYTAAGYAVLARRWRGRGGELDLVVRRGGETVFVEVKQGRSFGAAAARVLPRQIARLIDAAGEFAGTLPGGLDSAMRFDVACVDRLGRVEIIENAIWS